MALPGPDVEDASRFLTVKRKGTRSPPGIGAVLLLEHNLAALALERTLDPRKGVRLTSRDLRVNRLRHDAILRQLILQDLERSRLQAELLHTVLAAADADRVLGTATLHTRAGVRKARPLDLLIREAVDLRPRERPGRGRHRDAQSHGKRRCQARLLPPGLAELHRDGPRAAGGLAHHVPVPCDFQNLPRGLDLLAGDPEALQVLRALVQVLDA